jgi:hypothetical protein
MCAGTVRPVYHSSGTRRACHLIGVGGSPQPGDIKTTMGGESTYFNIVAAVNGMFGQDQTEVGRGDLASNEEVLQQFVRSDWNSWQNAWQSAPHGMVAGF